MNTDCYFEKGHTHKICQDYSIVGETENIVYAVLADGCSDVAKSDLGARLVAESFVPSIDWTLKEGVKSHVGVTEYMATTIVENYTLQRLANISRELKIGTRPLEATLVAAVFSKLDSKLRLYMWGDGKIVLKYSDRIVTYNGHYTSSAPYYLSYRLREDLQKGYFQEFGSLNAVYSKTVRQGETLEEFQIDQLESLYVQVDDLEDMEFALITSDGADSYQDEFEKSVEVFPRFLNFKNRCGEFVQRRMQRIKQEIEDVNYTHHDDISVAAINFK